MGKQRHDMGRSKRAKTSKAEPRRSSEIDGEQLARELVRRGLASNRILSGGQRVWKAQR